MLARIDRWGYIKLKTLHSKENNYQIEEAAYRKGEKSLPAIHLTRVISRTYKEVKKLNSKRTNNPVNKWINVLNRPFSKEEVQMANKDIKNVRL
jgi:hypothetical protein